MNDPHVVALNYRIKHNDTIDYSRAEPFDRDEPEFRLTVKDKSARFAFKGHYATEEQAREALAEYIRMWEFDATLKRDNPDSFRLEFEKAEIIDRNPIPSAVMLSANTEGRVTGSARLTTSVRKYPPPPSDIKLNPDAETMYQRYLGYRGRHELLPSIAYFCLSMLEDPPVPEQKRFPAKRKVAAKKFGIDELVLVEIGHLSTSRGKGEARKREGTAQPLTPKERHFLDQAVKAIIRRVAEKEHSPDGELPMISMSDLPSLEDD